MSISSIEDLTNELIYEAFDTYDSHKNLRLYTLAWELNELRKLARGDISDIRPFPDPTEQRDETK